MVNYDKNSFLSGVAVGRQMKGWATASGGGTKLPWLVEIPGGVIPEDTSQPGSVVKHITTVKMPEDTRGKNLKSLVDALRGLSGWALISSDEDLTADTYEATLRTNTDGVTVHFGNVNGYEHQLFIDGVQVGYGGGGLFIRGGIEHGVPLESEAIYIKGADWETFQFYRYSALGAVAATVTDYFDPSIKVPVVSSAPTYLAPFEAYTLRFAANNNGEVINVPTQGICPYPQSSGATMAAPLNVYQSYMGFSGFIGGMKNLYLCYDGTNQKATGTVDDTFQIAGHNFAGGGGEYGVAIRTS